MTPEGKKGRARGNHLVLLQNVGREETATLTATPETPAPWRCSFNPRSAFSTHLQTFSLISANVRAD